MIGVEIPDVVPPWVINTLWGLVIYQLICVLLRFAKPTQYKSYYASVLFMWILIIYYKVWSL